MIKLKPLLEYSYKKSIILDFDDTLATTETQVNVIHKDGSETLLTPAEYALYKPQPGDVFDYKQFDRMLRSPKPIDKIWKLLVASTKNPANKVTILTARRLAFPIRYWMKRMGLDVYVVAVGGSDPQLKVNWIEREIKKGAKDITFIDDSVKNVEAVKKLQNDYPNTKVVSITPEQSGSLKEFMGGATMNKPEIARHMKKLTKLKSYMAKQGDKMVPYPNLEKTVMGAKLMTGPNPLKIQK